MYRFPPTKLQVYISLSERKRCTGRQSVSQANVSNANGAASARYSKAPARHRAGAWGVPSAREIEGMGGRFFHEGA